MPTQHLTAELLEITLDRSRALGDELKRIRQWQYPPTGPEKLLDLAISANDSVTKDILNLLRSSSSLPPNPDRRIETLLRSKTTLLSVLHLLMQCLEGANIQYCPITFVAPIRSMLTRQLQRNANFDFIVKASRAYNYRVWSIHKEIKMVLREAGYSNLLADIPDPFFIMECPISERRNIPIHCIFAHEVGHIWYQIADLTSKLMPFAQNPGDSIEQKLIKASWVEELTADAIALCVFGPAYLYSFIYFAGPFCSMASDTHPPDNLRIQFMCGMLLGKNRQHGLVYKNTLSNNNNLDYVKQWQSYASSSVRTMPIEDLYRPIFPSIRSTIPHIMEEAKNLTGNRRYTIRKFNKDIPELCENIARGIPPNEIAPSIDTPKIAKAESILNAGWSYLISGDPRYAKLLGIEDKKKIRARLFSLISKGLEYSEMQSRWGKSRRSNL